MVPLEGPPSKRRAPTSTPLRNRRLPGSSTQIGENRREKHNGEEPELMDGYSCGPSSSSEEEQLGANTKQGSRFR